MVKRFLFILFIVVSNNNYAQDVPLIAILADSIKDNANAIIKENLIEIEITSYDKIKINTKRVITILNEYGMGYLDASEYFDKSTSIKNIEAKIYNSSGIEIKKIKQKDFRENSVSEGSIITDNRVMYLDYTPTQFPFTMVYTSEVVSSNTAFIPSWSPVDNYFVSTISSKVIIKYIDDVKLKYKEFNFDNRIKKVESKNHLEYAVTNIVAIKSEELSPSLRKFVPYVMFGLDEFNLEGVKGYANDWNTFGKWMYTNLLSDTEDISESTKQKLQTLVGQEKDKIEIAKIIYKHVQDKTRYVSIQLGIGGWRPMFAKDVDRLGYGDCKALTNYTRSLLKIFDVPSYYAVVYGDRNKRNIQEDFVSMQGNHVILGIPKKDEIIWLECTSQTQPFGFQGDFTDDRDLLIIKPEGGEIIKTKEFLETENIKKVQGSYELNENGTLAGRITIKSKGLQYDWEQAKDNLSKDDQIKRYKEEFSTINNLKITDITIHNDKNNIEFVEELALKAEAYTQNFNGNMMFPINAFSQNSFVPKKYKNRQFPFEVQRGYTDEDEVTITIPKGYTIESKPNDIELKTEFGYYKIEFTTSDSGQIVFKRKLIIKSGYYESSKYEEYRKFRETIAKSDNSKTVITKS